MDFYQNLRWPIIIPKWFQPVIDLGGISLYSEFQTCSSFKWLRYEHLKIREKNTENRQTGREETDRPAREKSIIEAPLYATLIEP